MKAILIPFAFVLFFINEKATACSCIFVPYFCQSISYQNTGGVVTYIPVYYVTVTAKEATGMTVNVHQTYSGENLSGQSIFVVSGDGANCQVFTDQFAVGESLIIATGKINDKWYMSECGISFLKVENGLVSGPISEGVTTVTLDEFPFLDDCGDLKANPIFEPDTPGFISINPTLTNGDVFLKAMVKLPSDLDLQVFDVAGRRVLQTKVINNGAIMEETIHTQDWASGVYFFNVEVEGKQRVFKVVKTM